MRLALFALLPTLAVWVPAAAQQARPDAPQICIVTESNGPAPRMIEAVHAKCRRGDSLIAIVKDRVPVPNAWTRFWPGSLCDLSKQVVTTDESLVCVYDGKKEAR
jgi:hypothetical protein